MLDHFAGGIGYHQGVGNPQAVFCKPVKPGSFFAKAIHVTRIFNFCDKKVIHID
jgi:hypothetical protein